MFNLSVPEDMNGKVITGLFKRGTELASREIKYKKLEEEDRLKRTIGKFTLSKKL
jgi:hypothetical protein